MEALVPARLSLRAPQAAGRLRGPCRSATGSRWPPGRCWWRRQARDPFLVALAPMLQAGLPWLIFGLYAGAIADRVNQAAGCS